MFPLRPAVRNKFHRVRKRFHSVREAEKNGRDYEDVFILIHSIRGLCDERSQFPGNWEKIHQNFTQCLTISPGIDISSPLEEGRVCLVIHHGDEKTALLRGVVNLPERLAAFETLPGFRSILMQDAVV